MCSCNEGFCEYGNDVEHVDNTADGLTPEFCETAARIGVVFIPWSGLSTWRNEEDNINWRPWERLSVNLLTWMATGAMFKVGIEVLARQGAADTHRWRQVIENKPLILSKTQRRKRVKIVTVLRKEQQEHIIDVNVNYSVTWPQITTTQHSLIIVAPLNMWKTRWQNGRYDGDFGNVRLQQL